MAFQYISRQIVAILRYIYTHIYIDRTRLGLMGLQGWEFLDPRTGVVPLELFGILLLDARGDQGDRIILPLLSDNQGNVYSVRKEAIKKHITAIIAMELLLHSHLNRVGLAPHHVKREYNQWADDLTHLDYQGFDDSKRYVSTPRTKLRLVPFHALRIPFTISPMPSAERPVKLGQRDRPKAETFHDDTGEPAAKYGRTASGRGLGHKPILEQYRVTTGMTFNLFQSWGAMLPKLATHWKRESGAFRFLSLTFLHVKI